MMSNPILDVARIRFYADVAFAITAELKEVFNMLKRKESLIWQRL